MGSTVNGIYVPDNSETGWGTNVSNNQRRLADRGHNVKAYGALGDGTTLDTTAIQAALDAIDNANGGTVIFPWTAGGYKFGALTWPEGSGAQDKWRQIVVEGKLIPTATMNIPARRLSIIGRNGAVWDQFQNYPAVEIDGTNISSGSVINLTGAATSAYLQGLAVTNINGSAHGILINQDVGNIRMRGVYAYQDAGATGSPLRVNGGNEGFGYDFDYCGFSGVSGGGHSMHFESSSVHVPRLISVRNSFINLRGIFLGGSVAATGTNYLFDNMLAENLDESFLTIVSSTSTFWGLSLRQIKTDDATQSPHSLINNTGTNTYGMTVEHCDGYSVVVKSGSDRVNGLLHHASGDVTMGQQFTTEYRDKNGRHFFDTPRADVMFTVSSGTTISAAGSNFIKLTHASPTTVTDFTLDVEGQTIVVLFTNSNVTIAHGTPIKLAGGVNFVGTANDTLTLQSDGTTWYEVARSVNG